ncbi:MAG: energy-coupling factor transporter ATPase [Erysipelotrichaceae bacterium]|nr:energy-coupling factor transporter ATPase [Erysipelotrichaceae bacterium]
MPIVFSHLNYIYSSKTPLEFSALKDINLEIKDNSFTMIVGHTGSGKSTLVQQVNALLIPTDGEVNVNGIIVDKNVKKLKNIKELRKGVGLVFQFPEYQLFEDTVLKDVSFGPKNFGVSEEESIKLAKEALSLVGIQEDLFERSPFELSGGQKRRVAIAGIIALNPKVLILDEPTAGLDPQGSREMMKLFSKIHEMGTTIVMITHDMDNVLKYASDVVVLVKGEVIKFCKPYEIFLDEDNFAKLSIEEPLVIKMAKKLNKSGKYHIQLDKVKDIDTLVEQIAKEVSYE